MASRVITAADLQYLGFFEVPPGEGPTQTLYYSFGAFALRRGRDGTGPLTFIMSGPKQLVSGWNQFAQAREFTYPGEALDYGPVASLVADYADIYGSAMQTATPTDGNPITYGFHYDQATNTLYWAYQTPYNLDHNPVLGATVFNADGSVTPHGPWKTDVHSGYVGGFITPIPAAYQASLGSKTHVMGSPPHVQNSATGFGGQLHALNLPAVADSTAVTRTTQALIDYTIANPQPRNVSGLILCQWNCTTNPTPACSSIYDSTQGGTTTAPQAYFGGSNPGGSYLLDWMDTAVWIDTPDLRGIVQFGQLVDTIAGHTYEDGGGVCHSWYGPGTCVHGQVDANHPSTGPGAGTLASVCWIWDPVAVLAGSPGAVLPTTTCHINTLTGATSIGEGMSGTGRRYRWGQAQFDPITNKIFVSEGLTKQYGCCTFVPRVHVFQVGGAYSPVTGTPPSGPGPGDPPPPPPAPPGQNNAGFVGQSRPSLIYTGATFPVTFTMQNTGATTWTPETQYFLGAQSPQDSSIWSLGRIRVPRAVAPGETIVFSGTATAPAVAGTYALQFRMLQEGVQWFGEFTALDQVVVTAALPPPPVPAPTDPPLPPPVLPPAPTVTVVYNKYTCTVTLTAATSPDGSAGWTAHLKVGTELRASTDKKAPYVLSATVVVGTPLAVVWTKGKTVLTQDVGPATP